MPRALLAKLPEHAKEIYEAAYKAAKKDGKDDERAAKIAISAVKRAGYSKDEKTGKWHKMHELPMYITKASIDPETGVRRWAATVSKFAMDVQNDEVTPAFYKYAIGQVEMGKRPVPVLCVSHIDKGRPTDDWVVGDTVEMYVDGEQPKAKGEFRDTPLGRAAFDKIRAELKGNVPHDERVRISMGFYDELTEPVAIKSDDGQELTGRRFLQGWIKHFALTRVPVVPETAISADMEVKMTKPKTRLEDAASIVGDELAQALVRTEKGATGDVDEKLVVKQEDSDEGGEGETYRCECVDCGHTMTSEEHCSDLECPECGGEMRRAERPGPGKKSEVETDATTKAEPAETRDMQIHALLNQLAALLGPEYTAATELANARALGSTGTSPPRATPADQSKAIVKFVDDFAAKVKSALLEEGDRQDKFKRLQLQLNEFGEGVTALVKGTTPPSGRDIADVVQEAVAGVVAPLQDEVASLKAELADLRSAGGAPAQAPASPRAMDTKACVVQQQQPQRSPGVRPMRQKAWKVEDLAWESTGTGNRGLY